MDTPSAPVWRVQVTTPDNHVFISHASLQTCGNVYRASAGYRLREVLGHDTATGFLSRSAPDWKNE